MPTLAAARRVLVALSLFALGRPAAAPARPPAPPPAPAAAWSDWAGGARVGGAPSIVLHGGRLEMYALGADGTLLRRRLDSGAWGSWTSLGGSLGSEPVAVAFADRVDVFYRGSDEAARLARVDASGVAWSSLGGQIASSVAVARGSSGDDVTLLVVGMDGLTWANERRGGAWSGWSPRPHASAATPPLTVVPWPVLAPLGALGSPAAACPSGLTRCGGDCVDTRSDPRHCGGCDHPCAGGACAHGACGGEKGP